MSDKKTKPDLTSLNDLNLDRTGDLPFVSDPSEALNAAAAHHPPLSADDAALFDEPLMPLPPLDDSPAQEIPPSIAPDAESDIPGIENVNTNFDSSDLPAMDPEILEMAAEPLIVEAHIPSLEAADSEALENKIESRSSAENRIEEGLAAQIEDVFKDVSSDDAAFDHIGSSSEESSTRITEKTRSEPSLTISPTRATEPRVEPTPPKPREPKAPLSSATAMGNVKTYSEKMAPSADSTAQVPYSLLIEGRLKVHEKEALLAILSRESLGIREVELDPQFEVGRVLIPRVSEYVGVLLVQALRNADVRMRLGPSNEIYPGKEDESSSDLHFQKSANTLLTTESARHPADDLPITSEPIIPGKKFARVIDTIQVSINLKAAQVASASNPAYQEAVQALKRQLKHIAYYRGANTLVSFKTQMHPLETNAQYKIIAHAVAAVLEDN